MPAPAPPAPAAENGAPRTELQELQLKATQVTDEVRFRIDSINNSFRTLTFGERNLFELFCLQSLESTRRMLALCEEVINHFLYNLPNLFSY